jgi:hypothetical protein
VIIDLQAAAKVKDLKIRRAFDYEKRWQNIVRIIGGHI